MSSRRSGLPCRPRREAELCRTFEKEGAVGDVVWENRHADFGQTRAKKEGKKALATWEKKVEPRRSPPGDTLTGDASCCGRSG